MGDIFGSFLQQSAAATSDGIICTAELIICTAELSFSTTYTPSYKSFPWSDASSMLLIANFIITSTITITILAGAKPNTDQGGEGVKKWQNNEDSVPQSDYRLCSALQTAAVAG